MAPEGADGRLEEKSSLLLLGLLGQEHSLDVGKNTTLGNCDSAEETVEFLVIPDGELQVTGDDPSLLVVPGSVASKLENLSSQVLHDGSQVDGSASSDTLSVVTLSQETVNPANGELQSSPAGSTLGLPLHFAALSSSRHDDYWLSEANNTLKNQFSRPTATKDVPSAEETCEYLQFDVDDYWNREVQTATETEGSDCAW